ncbi:hypothetical protein [Sulfuriferula thiophila]|uniref:hypothetical protein n=1 Tax=Sulfuriferula thiophila TaxID=1781211 RepID=UPI000F60F792|nr:hypothetical protein [Sulfuriferula thiophila]
MFSEQANQATVILAVETVSGYSLDDYVSAFQKSTVANMRFSDGGNFFENNWHGSGSVVNNSNRLNVDVLQLGSVFWRIVTIQTMPYDSSDLLVNQLQDELWSTVK